MNTWVANRAYERYDRMIPDIRKVQGKLEGKYIASRPEKEKELTDLYNKGDRDALRNSVNKEGKEIAKEATDAYRDLAIYLLVKYMDGNQKKTDADGNFIMTEYGLPEYPTFPAMTKILRKHCERDRRSFQNRLTSPQSRNKESEDTGIHVFALLFNFGYYFLIKTARLFFRRLISSCQGQGRKSCA